MDKSPAAMAVGEQCWEHGYYYLWCGHRKPIMITAAGRIIKHDIRDCLPYIVEPTSHSVASARGYGWDSAPAMAAGQGGDAGSTTNERRTVVTPPSANTEGKKTAEEHLNDAQDAVNKNWVRTSRRKPTNESSPSPVSS